MQGLCKAYYLNNSDDKMTRTLETNRITQGRKSIFKKATKYTQQNTTLSGASPKVKNKEKKKRIHAAEYNIIWRLSQGQKQRDKEKKVGEKGKP